MEFLSYIKNGEKNVLMPRALFLFGLLWTFHSQHWDAKVLLSLCLISEPKQWMIWMIFCKPWFTGIFHGFSVTLFMIRDNSSYA